MTKFERDENGLIKGLDYKYNEDGTINWREMIPKEYIVINSERFKSKPMPESIDGLEDRDLLILLGGIKEVAKIRGLIRRSTNIVESSPDRVVSTCEVEFIPNYETGGIGYIYSDAANATLENCSDFTKYYLETIASNRAFVRAVRNALRIDIVGADEVKGTGFQPSANSMIEKSSPIKPVDSLRDLVKQVGINSFEDFQKTLIKSNKEDFPESMVSVWQSFNDIPNDKIFKLMSLVKNAVNKGRSKKKKAD